MHKTLMAVCALSISAGVARGNLISNPSFETPVAPVGNFVLFNTGSVAIPGWTVTGPAGTDVGIVNNTFAQNGVTFEAFDGNQSVDLTGFNSNSTEGLMQSVATMIGTNYVLTFYIGNTTGGGIFGTTSSDTLKINGTQVGIFTNSAVAPTNLNWQQFSHSFTATTATTTIEFDNNDPASDNSNFLDLVDLEVGGTSTVPEPVSAGLVGSALAMLGTFLMRRKR
jgi:hypothetical protein